MWWPQNEQVPKQQYLDSAWLITQNSKNMYINLRFVKSVHHRTIQINHQPDATIFQFIILTFVYSSTCYRHSPAHPQWLQRLITGSTTNTARLSPRYEGKTRGCRCSHWAPDGGGENVTGPTTNTARLSPRYEGKTRGCHCSHWAPDGGWENARNMLSCK